MSQSNKTIKSFNSNEERIAQLLESIFMPYARSQREALYGNQGRFVHYTSAEAALNIIKHKRVWMRNTTCMSDYREVQHGYEIIHNFFSTKENWNAFVDAFSSSIPGVADEAFKLFDQWWNDIRFNSYITSISEHANQEDLHGRLSMWRAFGGTSARVAIVLRIPSFSKEALDLNVLFSPVAYLNEKDVHAQINDVIQNIKKNSIFLSELDRELIVGSIFHMLVAGVSCLKHEGFSEEREWRVVYSPKRTQSPLIESSTEVIGGVPQLVYKLPLEKSSSYATSDLDFTNIFDRLIIGPTQYPVAMREAFVESLMQAGVPDAGKRIFVSGIPIRI